MYGRPVTLHAPVRVASKTLTQSFTAPPGKIYLLYGDDRIFPLSLTMAAHAMSTGSSVAVVDGCNQFNVHLISRFARERKINPDTLLKRIFVSRGFTCYQMEQAVTNRLPAFLAAMNASTAMIFGLLDTFFDDQASLQEVRQILRRVLSALNTMKAHGTSVLVVCRAYNVLPKERNQLFATLKSGMDCVYRLDVTDEHKANLFLEQSTLPTSSRLRSQTILE